MMYPHSGFPLEALPGSAPTPPHTLKGRRITTHIAPLPEANLRQPGPYAKHNTPEGNPGRFFGDYCNWRRNPWTRPRFQALGLNLRKRANAHKRENPDALATVNTLRCAIVEPCKEEPYSNLESAQPSCWPQPVAQ